MAAEGRQAGENESRRSHLYFFFFWCCTSEMSLTRVSLYHSNLQKVSQSCSFPQNPPTQPAERLSCLGCHTWAENTQLAPVSLCYNLMIIWMFVAQILYPSSLCSHVFPNEKQGTNRREREKPQGLSIFCFQHKLLLLNQQLSQE